VVAESARPPQTLVLPRHVAIIMDGNGRWANTRALPRVSGHRAGIKPVRETVEHCRAVGIDVLTLFAFSSENWSRPAEEVRGLMSLFLDALKREIDELDANGIRVRFIGDRERLSPSLDAATQEAEARTAKNTGMQLVIAVAYGGRWDIVQSARRLAADVKSGKLEPDAIGEEMLSARLQTGELPEVDLLIRSGGEHRVSNFLLWDLAYSEIYFSDLLWPQFTVEELTRAFEFYSQRHRRFGRTAEQIEARNC
jgi:undecaprenyl diphosphate synthase